MMEGSQFSLSLIRRIDRCIFYFGFHSVSASRFVQQSDKKKSKEPKWCEEQFLASACLVGRLMSFFTYWYVPQLVALKGNKEWS